LQAVLITAAATIAPCLLVGLYAANARPGAVDRVALAAALVAVAAALAASASPLLVDYMLVVVAINRELRRLLDWGEGVYDPTPLLSLVPLATAGLMGLAVAGRWHQLTPVVRRAGKFLLGAMAYGFAVGVVRQGVPALFAAADWVTPLIVLYYGLMLRPSAATVRRWMTVLGTLGVLLGAYGIYQWTDPPPWDAAWVIWSSMYSMGEPLPYQLSICSTLESRGPAAYFFAVTTAALTALPTLRRGGGAVFAIVPAVALLLTQARTGLIMLVLTLLAAAVFGRRGGGGAKIILALVVAGGITAGVLARQEQSTVIFNRVGTLANVGNDGSANGRVDIARYGVLTVLSNPAGFGFGSGGTALKMAAKPGEGDAVGDNGYLEILSTLGLPGTALYAVGLGMLVQLAVRNKRLATAAEPTTHLGLGMLIALVPTLVIGNALTSAHAAYVWIFLSRHLAAQPGASVHPPRGTA
jgi:O-antigen ligase